MSRYRVVIEETARYTIDVDADNAGEARQRAEKKFLEQITIGSVIYCDVPERDFVSVQRMP